jgi:hypothetical protein
MNRRHLIKTTGDTDPTNPASAVASLDASYRVKSGTRPDIPGGVGIKWSRPIVCAPAVRTPKLDRCCGGYPRRDHLHRQLSQATQHDVILEPRLAHQFERLVTLE